MPQWDEDDWEDPDGFDQQDDEFTEEDEMQMRNGLRAIKERIPDWVKHFTIKNAEDALWDSYYDVDKAVAYLRNKYVPKTPASKAATPKSAKAVPPTSFPILGQLEDLSPALEFWGISWRGAGANETIMVPPRVPAGGLLGGSSKLKALANKRRQKTEPPTIKMDELKISEPLPGGEQQEASGGMPPRPAPEVPQKRPLEPALDRQNSCKRQRWCGFLVDPPMKKICDGQGRDTVEIEMETATPGETIVVRASASKKPSAFGLTLCGPAYDKRPTNMNDFLPLPYYSSPMFNRAAFSKPSPDDVVLAAQSKAGQKVVSKAKRAPEAEAAAQATTQMASLQVVEQPRKGKNLDVPKLYEERLKQPGSTRHASFVVVGHIDAGKSTTMGRLLLDLGVVDNRMIEKYKKDAAGMGKATFEFAWVLDTVEEERARGVTIDVAMKDFATDQTAFTLLDAPGHQDFVPNMIAGAGRADFGIVVVDGNTGAFERGLKSQTNEHILLLRSFGVQRLIVAANKLDMVRWSQERFDEIANQLGGYVGKIGFKPENVRFLPVSGLHGDNIVRRSTDDAAAWYTGPTLVEALEEAAAATTADALAANILDKPFRLPVSETYKSDKGERLICGRVGCGTVQIGDHVAVQPSGDAGHVKAIFVAKEGRDWAVAGENVELSLGGTGAFENISWGDVMCPSTAPARAGTEFCLRGLAFEHLLPMPLEVHRGRLKADGQIVAMPALLDKATGAVVKKRPRAMAAGAYGLIKFSTAVAVALEVGQRVVLRANGRTVAAGVLE